MDENKTVKTKKNTGFIILSIIELIIIIGLVVFIFYYNKNNDKKEVVKSDNKVSKVETKDNKKRNDTQFQKINPDGLVDNYLLFQNVQKLQNYEKILDNIKVDDKVGEFNVIGSTNDAKNMVYFDNNKADFGTATIVSVAIMDKKYIAVEVSEGDLAFYLYDKDMNLIKKFGSSYGLVSNSKLNAENLLIDSKNFIYYECKFNNDGTQTLDINLLKFNNGQYEEVLINEMNNVQCSAQS